jgi:uncharacterized membrane protein YfhO
MGVNIPAGNHVVEFKYLDISFVIGSIVTFLSIVLWFLYLVMTKKSKNKIC